MNQAKKPARVLVVDDEERNRRLLVAMLEAEGYTALEAADGAQALELARQSPPDLVLLDIMMPDMDGYEVARALKAHAATKAIPVVMVTALDDRDSRLRGLEAGAEEFVTKPVDRNELRVRVRNLLRLKEFSDHLEQLVEEAVQANEELRQRQDEVQSLNLKLAAWAVELEDANKQLRSFSHTVSHDLRSPLATINGFSAILQRKYAGNLEDKAKWYLSGISSEALRMTQIVEDILYLSNVDRSKLSRAKVDLSLLAMEIMVTLRDTDAQREVEFECATEAIVQCDERLIRIALVNLLSNAWKFTSKRADASISFRVTKNENETVFSVRDNGAGFDMEHAKRLFQPFERLHRNDEFPGFGVGLATVHRIVGLHQGRIWAEAVPDQGAAFHFVLGN